MICKWCGAGVSPADRKCTRCGRDLPAMSDCGGFYDVAPRAPRSPAAPKAAPVAAPTSVAPAPAAQPNKSGSAALAVVSLLATAVMLVCLILLMVRVGDLEDRVYSLDSQVEELQSALESEAVPQESKPTNPKPSNRDPEPTDPTDPEDPTTQPTESLETMEPTESQPEDEEKRWGWRLSDDLSTGEEGKPVELSHADLGKMEAVRNNAPDEKGHFIYTVFGENEGDATTIRVVVDKKKNEYTIRVSVEGDGLGSYAEDANISVCYGGQPLTSAFVFETNDENVLTLKISFGIKGVEVEEENPSLNCDIQWMDAEDTQPLVLELSGLNQVTI